MKVDEFEKAIIAKGLEPFHVFMVKGGQVKWFACKDTRPNSEYNLIVYDSEGRALVLPIFPDDLENIKIKEYPGGVSVNKYIAQRAQSLDLNFQK